MYLHLPQKSTIHLGKYIPYTWILRNWNILLSKGFFASRENFRPGWLVGTSQALAIQLPTVGVQNLRVWGQGKGASGYQGSLGPWIWKKSYLYNRNINCIVFPPKSYIFDTKNVIICYFGYPGDLMFIWAKKMLFWPEEYGCFLGLEIASTYLEWTVCLDCFVSRLQSSYRYSINTIYIYIYILYISLVFPSIGVTRTRLPSFQWSISRFFGVGPSFWGNFETYRCEDGRIHQEIHGKISTARPLGPLDWHPKFKAPHSSSGLFGQARGVGRPNEVQQEFYIIQQAL